MSRLWLSRRWRWLTAGLAVIVLLGAGGLLAYAAAPQVPRGLSVLDIPIGGRSVAAAERALADGLLAKDLTAPLSVRVEDPAGAAEPVTVAVEPEAVQLAVNVPATVAAAANRNPFAGWAGSGEVAPVVGLDSSALMALLAEPVQQVGVAPVLPSITYVGLTPEPAYPEPGRGLDSAQATELVSAAWLRTPEVVLPLTDVVPQSTAADVDQMMAELARPAVATPVTVTTNKGDFQLTPEMIAASLVLDSDELGLLTPHVDPAKLRDAIGEELAEFEVPPRSATVAGGQIVASSGGELLDTERLAQDLMPVLPLPTGRTVAGQVEIVPAQTTSEDLTTLGVKEQVSEFTTYFSGGPSLGRSINIIRGAEEVDGAVVRPGETFSLNDHTGPRGYAEGYKDAPIIMNGKLVPGVGGGMSQFTTTLFNAAYYAGLEDVEHTPHSIYFSTYPSVIESTIFYPYLDLKFRNNTPYGVLIDTSYTEDSITISMWSTKYYDSVETEWSERRAFTKPKTIEIPAGEDCIARGGSSGFTQDAWRIFRKDGKEIKREKFTWSYDAEPRVICK